MSNKKLNAVINIGGVVSGTLKRAVGEATKGMFGIGKEIERLQKRQTVLTSATRQFGQELRRARSAKEQDQRTIERLSGTYAKLQAQLDKTRRAQDRLVKAQHTSNRIVEGGKTAALGVGAGVAAAALVTKPLIGAAMERENVVNLIHNSGVSKEDGDAMVKAAEDAKQFGISTTKATETVGELRTAMGDVHHAIEALPLALKAISGLQLYDRMHKTELSGGDSAFKLAKIAEERITGTVTQEKLRDKMNWAFKALTGSNGKVSVDDMLTAVRGGKGAVAALSDEAFFGDTYLMQAMGAPGYAKAMSTLNQAWIGGHQTHSAFDHMMELGLLDKKKVKFDKTGKVKTVASDAVVDSQLLIHDQQKWVDKHLIPILQKKGINVEDEASLPAIQQFVNSITSNSNASNLLLNRIRSRISTWKDRGNVMMAHDAEQSDAANQQSSAGKEANARARLDDAESRMGSVLLPAFADAMTKAADALEDFNHLADESPRLFKAITTGFVGLTAGVAGLAAAGITGKLLKSGLTPAIQLLGIEAGTTTGKLAGVVGGLIGKGGLVFALSMVALEAAKMLGLPDTDKKKGADDVKNGRWWDATFSLPAGTLFRAGAAKLSGQSNEDIAKAIAEDRNPNVPVPKKAPPPVPQLQNPLAAAGITNTIQVGSVNLYQQPGQSGSQLAKDFMSQMQREHAKQSRSSMHDGVTQ